VFNKMKTLALGGAVAAAATAAVAAPTTVAHAASYNGVCGSSYGVIDSGDLGSLGTVYLTYSSSTGKNCVVTVRDNPGTRKSMGAVVSLAGAPWISDSGSFTTYAGPVYVSAAHRCIDWGGWIDSTSYYAYNEHCS
jgi:hypothetical protein